MLRQLASRTFHFYFSSFLLLFFSFLLFHSGLPSKLPTNYEISFCHPQHLRMVCVASTEKSVYITWWAQCMTSEMTFFYIWLRSTIFVLLNDISGTYCTQWVLTGCYFCLSHSFCGAMLFISLLIHMSNELPSSHYVQQYKRSQTCFSM